jgi:glycosyltransferase involved in cell wall biosynthesis
MPEKDKKTLLSVTIPTRNRPEALKKAIESCLMQDFQDFELIVTENSDNDTLSKRIVDSFNDRRIKYVRTGNLSMSNNWTEALKNCIGAYIYIMPDKIILHPGTFKNFINGIESSHVDLLSFRHGNDKIEKHKELYYWEKIKTQGIIDKALLGNLTGFHQYGIRGYSLLISKQLLQNIFDNFGSPCIPMSPDFTLAFFALLNVSEFAYCDNSFFSYNEKANSNGASFMFGGNLFSKFFADNGCDECYYYEYVPIKLRTVWNSVLNDFYRVCNICNVKYNIDDIDYINYWKNIFSEILHINSYFHIDKSDHFRKLFQYLEDKELMMNKEIISHIEKNMPVTSENINNIHLEKNMPAASENINNIHYSTWKNLYNRNKNKLKRITRLHNPPPPPLLKNLKITLLKKQNCLKITVSCVLGKIDGLV